ncbi:replication protein [Streptococcus suis]|uniref:Replication protein n=1 Tax=Streptococcus suis TaxID=1307 RepID=A0A0Z8GUT4_STRSU|nr:replication protein [Streptococcus suis]
MAKTKIYFWLKIDKKFFDNIFIKRLKTIPGGYTMTVIYESFYMGKSMFYEALQTALLDFACIFKNGELLQYKDGQG